MSDLQAASNPRSIEREYRVSLGGWYYLVSRLLGEGPVDCGVCRTSGVNETQSDICVRREQMFQWGDANRSSVGAER